MKKSDNKFVERFEKIENCFNQNLLLNSPAICRIKLQGYSEIRKKLEQPFDIQLHRLIINTGKFVCSRIDNIVFAYVQGSEISFLLSSYKKNEENPFLDNNIQKLVSYFSVESSMCFQGDLGMTMEKDINLFGVANNAFFTSKVFSIPKEEITNYFILQQRKCIHDSIHYWHDYYSPSEAKNKHSDKKMIEKDTLIPSWEEATSLHFKHGTLIYKAEIDFKVKKHTQGAFDYYTKYSLIPQETVTRKKWTPIPMKIRFEDDRKIIEELL